MKNIRYFITIIILLTISIPLAFAQEQDNATDSAELDQIVQEKIKERVQQVKGTANKDSIYFRSGTVQQITNENIELIKDGDIANVEIASDAAIYRFTPGIGRSEITLDQIEIDEYLIAMGYQSISAENLLAKRIVISPEPTLPTKRNLLTGTVAEIDESTITVSTANEEKEIKYDSNNTELKIKDIEDPSLDNIVVEDDIAVVYSVDEDNEINTVKNILVIPGEANPESTENEVE